MQMLLNEGEVGVIRGGDSPFLRIYSRYKAAEQLPEQPEVEIQKMGEYTGLEQPEQGAAVHLGFPNLLSCQGVVCVMSNGSMIGAHIAAAGDEELMIGKMKELIAENGGIKAVKRTYVSYDKDLRNAMNGGDMLAKANALELPQACQLHFVDTSKQRVDGVQRGTFVQFTAMGRESGRCLVESKPQAQMEYTHVAKTMQDDRGADSNRPVGVTVKAAVKADDGRMNHISHKGPDRIIRMK